jgi:transcriptional regulator with XRE-family HTH domain
MALTHVGERIAEERERRLLTQAELAQRARISQSTLSQIESGRVPHPHLGTLRKIARALEIEPQELTSPKAQAPSSKLGEGNKGRREADLTLINSWAIALEDLRDELQELLDELPSLPDDAADLRVRTAEIQRLINRFDSIQHAVNTSGADRLIRPYAEALQARVYLPSGLHGAVTAYLGAQKALNLDLIPRANKWRKRAEVILKSLKAADSEPAAAAPQQAEE